MDDLGRAMSGGEKKYMLGGGNPAHLPQMNALWRRRMQEILADGDSYERMLANYDPPQGNPAFLKALAGLLRREYGWDLGPENIAVTNGSQASFYILFNMLGGLSAQGRPRRILVPVIPEYIGYADQSIQPDGFVGMRPSIEMLGEHSFKYHVDFSRLTVTEEISAICVSRPTNPTGNVLTDDEIAHLDSVARAAEIPLIIDNAYGDPFPGMIFEDVRPIWNRNIILGMSLSKIGLPSTRTGILVARPEIIRAVSSCNAILSLANGSVGQTILTPLLESGEILRAGREYVRPFYQEKSRRAQEYIRESFGGDIPYAIHKSEGSLFLWIWFRDLPITTMELYERLKLRNTIVVPGRYFFFGLEEEWPHRDECIRVNFAMADEDVRAGVAAIAEEARAARGQAG